MQELTTRNAKLMHFDNTTIYFQSFSRDGKHDEDQMVVAMAVDNNGIPFHYKVLKWNTAHCQNSCEIFNENAKNLQNKRHNNCCW